MGKEDNYADSESGKGNVFSIRGMSHDGTTTLINDDKNTFNCYDWCGLRSKDPDIRLKAHKRFIGCSLMTVMLLVLALFVIIPAIIRSIVHKSSLEVESVTLQYPSNTSFQSTTVQKFSGAGSLSAKAKMNALNVFWNNNGVIDQVISLTDSGTVKVGGASAVTMTSIAEVTNAAALSDMLLFAINAPTIDWDLDGSADVTFITTARVSLSKSITLNGYDSFPVPPNISTVSTRAGVTNTLTTAIVATMTSVASMQMHLGQNLYFNVRNNGTIIGHGEIPNFVMTIGSFQITATVNLTYSNTAEYQQLMLLMSNYSMGIPSPLNLVEFYTKDPIVWLAPALNTMDMTSSMPGVTEHFLQMFYLYEKVIPENIPFSMVIYNTEDVPLNITAIIGILIYEGVVIADVYQPSISIYVPPGHTVNSSPMTSSTAASPAAATAYNNLIAAGGGLVDTVATLTMVLGESFEAVVSYQQYNITLVVVPPGPP